MLFSHLKTWFLLVLLCAVLWGGARFALAQGTAESPAATPSSPPGAASGPTTTPPVPATDETEGAAPAETAPTAESTAPAPRPGVPSFWQAVDTTITTWAAYIQGHVPLWQVLLGAAIAFYLTGLAVCHIALSCGVFGPTAAAVGLWFANFMWFCAALLLAPTDWPWWTPFALFCVYIAATAILIGIASKKSAA